MKLRWHIVVTCVLWAAVAMLAPAGALDGKLFYTPEQAISTFAAYTPEQWAAYFWMSCVDLIFIGVYTSLLVRVGKRLKTPRVLMWAPGVLDLIETGTLMAVHLGARGLLELPLGFVTLAKWAVSAVAISAVALSALAVRRFRN